MLKRWIGERIYETPECEWCLGGPTLVWQNIYIYTHIYVTIISIFVCMCWIWNVIFPVYAYSCDGYDLVLVCFVLWWRMERYPSFHPWKWYTIKFIYLSSVITHFLSFTHSLFLCTACRFCVSGRVSARGVAEFHLSNPFCCGVGVSSFWLYFRKGVKLYSWIEPRTVCVWIFMWRML